MYGRPSAIWIRTLFVVVAYAAAIYVLHRHMVGPRFDSRALALALSFSAVQSAAIVVMLAALLTRRGIAQRRARRSRVVAADAYAAVSEHAAGADRLRVLRTLQSQSRRDVAAALAAFLGATRGSMHERVAALARDLGVTEREAAAEEVIDRAAASTLYDRAILADELRPRAVEIVAREISCALAIGDESHCIAALDLLRAWRRAFTVQGFEHALTHPSAEVRSRAFAVLPYVQPQHHNTVAEGLRDASPQVRIAAAQAAAKLRLGETVPPLADALGDHDPDVALAAAFALATIPAGLAYLQHRNDRPAFEAVEKAALGRLELA